ncbi:uncharacterized protein [Elaeis guineensis]|uniref:uncharacterized protein n=1 Tax=Elaeis guineensis var. tenera TaxID=51953 RepID=UPI003C6D57CF
MAVDLPCDSDGASMVCKAMPLVAEVECGFPVCHRWVTIEGQSRHRLALDARAVLLEAAAALSFSLVALATSAPKASRPSSPTPRGPRSYRLSNNNSTLQAERC